MTGKNDRWGSHKDRAEMENIEFLISVGLHLDRIASRLGITREALDKKIERSRSGKGFTDSSTEQAAG